jgi:ABC-2 type transport system permease protein
MICLRRIKALLLKEGMQIIRDPSTLLITVFLPLLLIFIYGSGVSLDIKHLKIALVLEDRSKEAFDFSSTLTHSPYFEVTTTNHRHFLDEKLMEGSISGLIVIPSYFTKYLHREGKIAPIQLIADGSETNTANFVINYVNGAYTNFLTQEVLAKSSLVEKPIINVKSRFWYNEELESRYYILSGSLAITMTLIGAMLTALVVAREWERGTMESLLSTPVRSLELVLGKVFPYFALGMISMAICVAFTVVGYKVPFRGSYLLLTLVSAVFLYCSLGLGLMISTIAKSQVLAYQITLIVAFLPAYMLSGFLFEILSMPTWIQMMTTFIPAKYFVQSLQTLFLVGNVWSLIFFDILVIGSIGSIFFIITAYKTERKIS